MSGEQRLQRRRQEGELDVHQGCVVRAVHGVHDRVDRHVERQVVGVDRLVAVEEGREGLARRDHEPVARDRLAFGVADAEARSRDADRSPAPAADRRAGRSGTSSASAPGNRRRPPAGPRDAAAPRGACARGAAVRRYRTAPGLTVTPVPAAPPLPPPAGGAPPLPRLPTAARLSAVPAAPDGAAAVRRARRPMGRAARGSATSEHGRAIHQATRCLTTPLLTFKDARMIPQPPCRLARVDLFDRAGTPRKRGAGAPDDARRRWRGPSSASSTRAATATFTVARLKLERGGDGRHRRRQPGRACRRARCCACRGASRPRRASAISSASRATPRSRPQTHRGHAPLSRLGADQGHRPRVRVAHRRPLRHRDAGDPGPRSGAHQRGAGHRAVARPRRSARAWSAQREVRKVMVFLQGYGVSPAFAARIYKTLRRRARSRACARTPTGWPSTSGASASCRPTSWRRRWASRATRRRAPRRACATCSTRRAATAHVFVPRAAAGAEGGGAARPARGRAPTRPSIGWRRRATSRSTRRWSRTRARPRSTRPGSTGRRRRWRPGCASCSPRRRRRWRSTSTRALAWYEREAGIALARQQAEAVEAALSAKVAVITGGPGVGKTTIVRGIVSILGEEGRARSRWRRRPGAPPSGSRTRPACRRRRCTGCWSGGPPRASFARNAARPLEADVLIVDEASMVDVRLGADLVAALPPSARLVLVGDVDQLPSVGPGTRAARRDRQRRRAGRCA